MTLPDRDWKRNKSYSQWVRDALARARGSGAAVSTLFDSSVPEPRDLLRDLIVDAVEPGFSDHFKSAFGDGNPDVLRMLGESYGIAADRVLSTSGATSGLSLVYRAVARPDDEILFEAPGFDLFADLAISQGLRATPFARRGERFAPDLEEIEGLIGPKTRLIVISNLHNPSGMEIPHATMLELATLAERKQIHVVVDEVYGDYADPSVRPMAAVNISPWFISVSSLTKIYGLAILRCGWIAGSAEVVGACRALNARVEFSVSTLTHALGAHVLAKRSRFDAYSAAVIAETRPVFDHWVDDLREEGLIAGELPDYGCICFPRLPAIADTEAFSEWLCGRSGVLVAPGECFGAPGHIRIGFAQPMATLQRSLDALADGIREYSRSMPSGAILRATS